MIQEKARSAVEENHMFDPGDLVVVGVSGGPDSVALLHWLLSYARNLDVKLHVAHLNHMLRGKDSEADAHWVAALSHSWGLPVTVESRDINALRQERQLSIEDAARQARYAFFAEVAKETGARCVAVAHTADDQVETVVLHLLRGAGLAGMRGLLPVTDYHVPSFAENGLAPIRVIRPFLEVTRDEVEEYLHEYNLEFRTDRSNLEIVYLRNKIRHQLIPQLLEYNPRFKEATLRAAEIAAIDFDFIQEQVTDAWQNFAQITDERVSFDLKVWSTLHPCIQRYLLRRSAQWLLGDLVGLEAVHVADALAIISQGRTGAVVMWPQGLRVIKEYDTFCVCFERPTVEPVLSIEGQPLMIPGDTDIVGSNWRVTARVSSVPCGDVGPWHADLDYSKTGDRLLVRRRRAGDRFRPLGMKAEKSLQDFLVDEKVPRYRRDDVPIVEAKNHIIWVAGLRIDDRAKLTPKTKEVLCLSFAERS